MYANIIIIIKHTKNSPARLIEKKHDNDEGEVHKKAENLQEETRHV